MLAGLPATTERRKVGARLGRLKGNLFEAARESGFTRRTRSLPRSISGGTSLPGDLDYQCPTETEIALKRWLVLIGSPRARRKGAPGQDTM